MKYQIKFSRDKTKTTSLIILDLNRRRLCLMIIIVGCLKQVYIHGISSATRWSFCFTHQTISRRWFLCWSAQSSIYNNSVCCFRNSCYD